MRERLWSQRMLALYRCGRQAEALRVFRDLRAVLVDELGIEPGHDVSWLEHAVLAQDPALDFPAPPESGRRPRHEASAASSSTKYQVRVPASQSEGPAGRPGPRVGAPARLVGVGRPGRGAAAAGRRRPGHREDASRGRPGGRRRGGRVRWSCGAAATRIRWRRSSPSQRRSGATSSHCRRTVFRGMPDWQLTELSRLVLRLREYGRSPRRRVAIPKGSAFVSSRRSWRRSTSCRPAAPSFW